MAGRQLYVQSKQRLNWVPFAGVYRSRAANTAISKGHRSHGVSLMLMTCLSEVHTRDVALTQSDMPVPGR